MEIWLVILLPVAAASGWYAARRAQLAADRPAAGRFGSDYLRGLNFLISEQPDKAIDVFVRMLEVNGDTVETHLALGNLFRKRGEADRAVRIHQNLIARPTLTREQRAQALLELAQDYMHAGLLDRAEGVFQELVDAGMHVVAALTWLVDIYQQEKEWDKAINTARKLAAKTGRPLDGQIAQYYCEIAEMAIGDGQTEKARSLIKRSLSHDPGCVRASILQGRLDAEAGDWRAAIRSYKRVWTQDPAFVAEVIIPMLRCYEALNKPDEFVEFLREVLKARGEIVATLPLEELMQAVKGNTATEKLLVDQSREHPSLRGLCVLARLYSETPGNDVASEAFTLIRDAAGRLTAVLPQYRCTLCGFGGKRLHWQCPSCKAWNSVVRVSGDEALWDNSASTQRPSSAPMAGRSAHR